MMIGYKIILFISFTFLLSDCPDGHLEYQLSTDDFVCFYNNDIDFLNGIIDNNCADYDQNGDYTIVECFFGPESGMINDYNNDGIVQPNEICMQTWSNSSNNDFLRLQELNCAYSNENLIGNIPSNIGNFKSLKYCSKNSNAVTLLERIATFILKICGF